MTSDDTRSTGRRSVALPAAVLLVLVTSIAGAVLWLSLTPLPAHDEAPAARIELAPADGIAARAAGATEQAEAPADGPAAPEPDAAASPAESAAPPAVPDGSPATPSDERAGSDAAASAAAPATPPEPVPLSPVISALPPAPPSFPLSKAPAEGLFEQSPVGPLPIIGRDGRESWRVYARPFNRDDTRPRVAVVLHGLGNSDAVTRTAIQGLPGAITLAFTPYAGSLPEWIASARAAGHEALLMVPMEPVNYPDFDPGPQALLTSLDGQENRARLEWVLGRAIGYVGVTDFMGSRFTSSAPHMREFFNNLRSRGLMFLESRPGARAVTEELAAVTRVPFAANTLYIDTQASQSAIDAQLGEAERLARRFGEVVVMGYVHPVTIERVAHWAQSMEGRGFVLAPVSALAKRKEP